jgi:biopolymer transport protein ExbD
VFTFSHTRPRRRPSLTPMIDVVFLLLVFFMLAARFGQDHSLPLNTSGSSDQYEGPPRVVTLAGDKVLLNGIPLALEDVMERLSDLVSAPTDTIFVQPRDETDLQQLVHVIDALAASGFTSVVVVGSP